MFTFDCSRVCHSFVLWGYLPHVGLRVGNICRAYFFYSCLPLSGQCDIFNATFHSTSLRIVWQILCCIFWPSFLRFHRLNFIWFLTSELSLCLSITHATVHHVALVWKLCILSVTVLPCYVHTCIRASLSSFVIIMCFIAWSVNFR